METARCPDCGEQIGGGNHELLSSNNRNTEFEEIGRARGDIRSPWRWAQ